MTSESRNESEVQNVALCAVSCNRNRGAVCPSPSQGKSDCQSQSSGYSRYLAHSRYMEELPGNQTVLVFFNLFAVERAKVISLEGNVAGLRKKNPLIHVPLDTNLL